MTRLGEPVVRIERVECTRETAAALLCVIGGNEHWIPRGQISDESLVTCVGDYGPLIITQWLAKQRGFY